MIGREAPAFDPSAFDEAFFEQYETQMADIDVAEQASAALSGVLQVENDDGTHKTYEQIRDESRIFFSNDAVRESEALMNRLAEQFRQACVNHVHGDALRQDEALSKVHDHGQLGHDPHTYGKGGHDDEYSIDPVTGRRKRKSGITAKKRALGWYAYAHSYGK
jgi:hypothetical protein